MQALAEFQSRLPAEENGQNLAGSPGHEGHVHAAFAFLDGKCILKSMGQEGQLWCKGVRHGDQLLSVDDVAVQDLTLQQVRERISGREGTSVCLRFTRREGGTDLVLIKPWNVSVVRTSSYVIDCLLAMHEELLVAIRQANTEDLVLINFSSSLVAEAHGRVLNAIQTLKRGQHSLLHKKAQLEREIEEMERRAALWSVDARLTHDEQRRMYKELEEREKMMQLMASDFDEALAGIQRGFSAVSIQLSTSAFDTTFDTTEGGKGSKQSFSADLCRALSTDEHRVAIVWPETTNAEEAVYIGKLSA
jgi:hypothetical protein